MVIEVLFKCMCKAIAVSECGSEVLGPHRALGQGCFTKKEVEGITQFGRLLSTQSNSFSGYSGLDEEY